MEVTKIQALKQKLQRDREVAYNRNAEKKKEEKRQKKLSAKCKIPSMSCDTLNISVEENIALKDLIEAGPSNVDKADIASSLRISVRKKLTCNADLIQERSNHTAETIPTNGKVLQKSRPKKKKVSEEERNTEAYKRKRELAHARKRKFLDKMTAEEKEMKRRKGGEYYQRKKDEGHLKPIHQLPKREQKRKRQNWKEASSKYRKRKRDQRNIMSPPTSEDEGQELNEKGQNFKCRKEMGRKKVKRDRAKAYREIKKEVKIT